MLNWSIRLEYSHERWRWRIYYHISQTALETCWRAYLISPSRISFTKCWYKIWKSIIYSLNFLKSRNGVIALRMQIFSYVADRIFFLVLKLNHISIKRRHADERGEKTDNSFTSLICVIINDDVSIVQLHWPKKCLSWPCKLLFTLKMSRRVRHLNACIHQISQNDFIYSYRVKWKKMIRSCWFQTD